MARPRLTPNQKRIIALMREYRFAIFGSGSRDGLHHAPIPNMPAGTTGVYIAGYQLPQYFLKVRGLIEPVPRAEEPDSSPGRSGVWMRLTTKGMEAT